VKLDKPPEQCLDRGKLLHSIKMKLLGKENKNGQIYSNVSNIMNVLQHQLYNSV
jgi:hypothetical protein